MVNLFEIVDRVKKLKGFSSDKDFANILDISAPDFSKRKKSGTLLPLLIDWGIAEIVNFDWLLRGEGAPYIKEGPEEEVAVREVDDDPVIAELLEGTRKVLKSGNRVAFEALERNIRYFSLAVETEKRLADIEARMSRMEHDKKETPERIRTDDSSKAPNEVDRRSGLDRRKTGSTG